MGLLSDVWDYVRSKVKDLIAGTVTDLKIWVRARIASAIDAVDWVVNNITKYVTNVYKTVKEYVMNVYNYVTEHITNVVNNITKYVTNKYITTNEYITNVIGVSREWVDNQLAGLRAHMDAKIAALDTVGFFKNPLAYVSGVYAAASLARENKIVESFLEGFEEGLEGEG